MDSLGIVFAFILSIKAEEVNAVLKDTLPKINTELPGPRSREVLEIRDRYVPKAVSYVLPVVIDRGGRGGNTGY
jgi:hypothetical protein